MYYNFCLSATPPRRTLRQEVVKLQPYKTERDMQVRAYS